MCGLQRWRQRQTAAAGCSDCWGAAAPPTFLCKAMGSKTKAVQWLLKTQGVPGGGARSSS